MRKATIKIQYDAEKLRTICRYMGKKDADLQTGLDDVMQKIYEKHVPAPVREYIESRDADEPMALKQAARPAVHTE